jgi:hypothetical protein
MDILFCMLDWLSLVMLGIMVLYRRKRMPETPLRYLSWWVTIRGAGVVYAHLLPAVLPGFEVSVYNIQLLDLAALLTLLFFLRQLSETWLTRNFFTVVGSTLAGEVLLWYSLPAESAAGGGLVLLSMVGLAYSVDFLVKQVRLPIPQSVPNVPLFWMVCGMLVFYLGAVLVYGAGLLMSAEQLAQILPGLQYTPSLIHLCSIGMQVLVIIGILQLRRSWYVADAFSFNV